MTDLTDQEPSESLVAMDQPLPSVTGTAFFEHKSQDLSTASDTQAPDFASWQEELIASCVKKVPRRPDQFPFLELPAEIRAMIYAQHFSYRAHAVMVNNGFIPGPKQGDRMAILRVSKQIYGEAGGFIPHNCTIIFRNPYAAVDIATTMGRNFGNIRHMEIRFLQLLSENKSFVLPPWTPFLKLLQTGALALRSLILSRGDRRPTSVALLDALDDASALGVRKKEVIMFLIALCKIKHLRSLTIYAKIGSAGLTRLEKNLGAGVKLDNRRWRS